MRYPGFPHYQIEDAKTVSRLHFILLLLATCRFHYVQQRCIQFENEKGKLIFTYIDG